MASPLDDPTSLRQRILTASVALLEEQGVAGLSLREVARRAGVSHQAPYHHFADRPAILAAIAEEGFHLLEQSFLAAQAGLPSDPFTRVTRVGEAYVRFALEHPAHFRVMFRPELVDLAAHRVAHQAGDQAFHHLVALTRECQAAGLSAGAPEDAVVATIWSVAHGLASLLLDGPLAITSPASDPEALITGVMRVAEQWMRATAAGAGPPGGASPAGPGPRRPAPGKKRARS